ncbi:MAG: hypothetical protein EA397_19345 [Deltaproteobacteria bacterium]|nr:MAG: hypothetical protein EA397_19345 [Deltaproteobacteria bacterium]
MKWALLGVGLVVGIALGVLIPLRENEGGTTAPPEVSASVEPAPCPQFKPLLRQAEDARARITLLEQQIRGLRASEIELVGAPVPWPEDLPAAYRDEGARATVERALEGTRYQLDDLDCAEFPCLAKITWTAPHSESSLPYKERHFGSQQLQHFEPGARQISMSSRFDEERDVDENTEWMQLLPEGTRNPVSLDRLKYRIDGAE